MAQYNVREIDDLLKIDFGHLVVESKKDGFRFLERLVKDYENGVNIFSEPGEVLCGVFNGEGLFIAIGGLNIDPYTSEEKIGRLRRFYVAKDYRRAGVGRFLLDYIVVHAKRHFDTLVLHTDTEQADKFYRSYGFLRSNGFQNSTHHIDLVMKEG